MADGILEKIIVKKKGAGDLLVSMGIVAGGLVLSFVLFIIPYVQKVALLLTVGVIYGIYFLLTSRNIEYEYSVIGGDLNIDTIVAQRKRKKLFFQNSKDFEIMGKYKGDKYTSSYENISNKIIAVSAMQSDNIYFIVTNYNKARTIIFFEPDPNMIEALRLNAPSKVSVS